MAGTIEGDEVHVDTAGSGVAPAALAQPDGGGYLSADQLLENAPLDLEERDVEAFGGKLRIRALTAAQQDRVNQQTVRMNNKGADVMHADRSKLLFGMGVVEPKLDPRQVEQLHRKSGKAFGKVVKAIVDLSGMNEEELRAAQQDFRDPEE